MPFCPHCGAALPPVSSPPALWPPPPSGQPPFLPPAPRGSKLVTGRVWGDVVLGIVLTLAAVCVGGLGLIVMPIVYALVRANYAAFGRAIGYTLLLCVVLVLGALAACFYSLKYI